MKLGYYFLVDELWEELPVATTLSLFGWMQYREMLGECIAHQLFKAQSWYVIKEYKLQYSTFMCFLFILLIVPCLYLAEASSSYFSLCIKMKSGNRELGKLVLHTCTLLFFLYP